MNYISMNRRNRVGVRSNLRYGKSNVAIDDGTKVLKIN